MSSLYLVIMILLFLSLLPIILTKKNSKAHNTKKHNLPPGPKKLPIIGNLHQLISSTSAHTSLHHLSLLHGPLMFLQLGRVQTLVVSSADALKDIVKSHDIAFSGRPTLYCAKKLSYGNSDLAFSPYGEYWRQARKLCFLELLSLRRVQSYRPIRESEIDHLMDSIESSNGPVDLSEMVLGFMNRVVCRIVFGRGSGGAGLRNLTSILKETQELMGGFCLSDFFPGLEWVNVLTGLKWRLERNFGVLDEFYDVVIEEHLARSADQMKNDVNDDYVEDLVDVLVRVGKDHGLGINHEISRDHIKGILTDMFIAGTDTSSASIIWTMTELMKNPTIMRKAQEEVRRIIGKKQRVEESDLHKLHYLKLVVKEGLRMHPPAPLLLPRETTEKCIIGEYEIPSQTRVLINAKAISMDPKYWDDPQEFRPERFLERNVDFKGHDFELIPFGVGRRGCPGLNFATLVIELTLANLLRCFDWEMPVGMTREDIDMEEASGLTMNKKVPLCLVANANTY